MFLRLVFSTTLLSSVMVFNTFSNAAWSAGNNYPVCPDESYFTTEGNNGIRYGWFEHATCVFESSTGTSDAIDCIDPNNDGWGWNGVASCRMTPSEAPAIADNCEKLQSGDYRITDLVTDVFLAAGQSNAAGADTLYQPDLYDQDKVNDRVLVWTEKNTWEIANPRNQTWHDGTFPSGPNHFYNHPAFQIGRAIADLDECRVVAFIPTAAPGASIDRWLYNQDGEFSDIVSTVNRAINALHVRHQVDMIWWMQGESDNDPVVSRYYDKLNDLITKFRNQTWFPHNGYFLANETGWSTYANQAIRLLGTDSSEYTDYSRGEDSANDPFPNVAGESIRTHFNEVALRKIGDLVARKYLYEYLNRR